MTLDAAQDGVGAKKPEEFLALAQSRSTSGGGSASMSSLRQRTIQAVVAGHWSSAFAGPASSSEKAKSDGSYLSWMGLELLSSGDCDGAVSAFSRALGHASGGISSQVANLVNLGAALGRRGDAGPAVAALRAAIAAAPVEPVAYVNLGICLRMVGEFEAGLVAIQEAIRLRPDCAEASSNACALLVECGRFDDAVHCARHAFTALRSNQATIAEATTAARRDAEIVRYNYARVCLEAGREDESLTAFTDLGGQNSLHLLTKANSLNNLGYLYFAKSMSQPIAAADAFSGAMALMPDSALFAANHGVARLLQARSNMLDQQQVGQMQFQAIASLKRAIALSPHDHRAYNNLGVALTAFPTQIHEAITAFVHAVQLAPSNYYPKYAANLGLLLLCAALAEIEASKSKVPTSVALNRASQAVAFLRSAADADQNGRYMHYVSAACMVQQALAQLCRPAVSDQLASCYDTEDEPRFVVITKTSPCQPPEIVAGLSQQ